MIDWPVHEEPDCGLCRDTGRIRRLLADDMTLVDMGPCPDCRPGGHVLWRTFTGLATNPLVPRELQPGDYCDSPDHAPGTVWCGDCAPF